MDDIDNKQNLLKPSGDDEVLVQNKQLKSFDSIESGSAKANQK